MVLNNRDKEDAKNHHFLIESTSAEHDTVPGVEDQKVNSNEGSNEKNVLPNKTQLTNPNKLKSLS